MPTSLFSVKETKEDPAVLTPWSVPHVLVGLAAKERGIPLGWFFMFHGMYELKDAYENYMDIQHNSHVNSLGDQAVATIGHLIGKTNTKSYVFTTLYIASWVGCVALGDRIG